MSAKIGSLFDFVQRDFALADAPFVPTKESEVKFSSARTPSFNNWRCHKT